MSIRKSTTLQLARAGYLKALAAEPGGLLMEFVEFRVAQDSQPQSLDFPWGTEVYRGRISDYELVGENTLVFTCAIPPEVREAALDSIALYDREGTILAQGFMSQRKREPSSTTYIYAYLNAPTAIEPVELEIKTRGSFPQVHNYKDLPSANTARRFEFVVSNGHCGAREDYPEYLPTMVMLSANAPKTVVYPPAEPFLDPDVGTLASGTYTYSVTARNAGGESMTSPTHEITLVPLQPPSTYTDPADGALATGTYYYQVVAVSPGGGKTTGSAQVSESVTKLPTPSAPSLTEFAGGLDNGTYFYAVSALSATGETLASTPSSIAVADDASVAITWTSVTGAVGYTVYRGTSIAGMRKLFDVDASETSALDWGQDLDTNREPRSVASDAGVRISWDRVPHAIAYEVYGRAAGGSKMRLAVLPDNVFFWTDRGLPDDGTAIPASNSTSSGVEVKWSKVPGATGYSIYGRTSGDQRLIGTVGDVSNFIDTGSTVPSTAPPATNTTAAVEWQLVDGALVYRGAATTIGPDWFTVPGYLHSNQDIAMVSVVAGTGAGQSRHVWYNVKTSRFELLDAPWTPIPTGATLTVWAAPGCCGGVCPDYTEEDLVWSPPPTTPPAPPKYAHLGVHICGVFLGAPQGTVTPASQVDRAWVTRSNSEYVDSGLMDYIFCNENGKTDLVTAIDNVITTPHGNRAPVGDYSSIRQSFARAVTCTIDSIAIPEGLRVIVYRNPNFTGDILFDETGPYYMVNGVWRSQSNFAWALDPVVWADATVAEIIPSDRRFWSLDDMRELWRNGSMQVVRV